jgi:hypothetical protein
MQDEAVRAARDAALGAAVTGLGATTALYASLDALAEAAWRAGVRHALQRVAAEAIASRLIEAELPRLIASLLPHPERSETP